ncbi:hypothetical protein OS493_038449 [Desmophyllum pertusum]|uniref:Uncharacterized protein n=1 Tax=Desmophyllum pertusum TaxID=174260 RepID=A0A9W9Z6D8_9CNID|nr:hypothetical protein OS493_038449 [Desmophyllum pertusum]
MSKLHDVPCDEDLACSLQLQLWFKVFISASTVRCQVFLDLPVKGCHSDGAILHSDDMTDPPPAYLYDDHPCSPGKA